jgi:hypothetical protein
VIFIDPYTRKLPARERATFLGHVGDRDDLNIRGILRPLTVRSHVSPLGNKAVSDDRATQGRGRFMSLDGVTKRRHKSIHLSPTGL